VNAEKKSQGEQNGHELAKGPNLRALREGSNGPHDERPYENSNIRAQKTKPSAPFAGEQVRRRKVI